MGRVQPELALEEGPEESGGGFPVWGVSTDASE